MSWEYFLGTSPIKNDDATLAHVAFLLRRHNFSRRHATRYSYGAEKAAMKKLYLKQKDELYLNYAFKSNTTTSSYYNYQLAP